jgi:hypothetical protein
MLRNVWHDETNHIADPRDLLVLALMKQPFKFFTVADNASKDQAEALAAHLEGRGCATRVAGTGGVFTVSATWRVGSWPSK